MAADYYAILKNAIGALPETSGEARRAVYEKARRAVVDQLKAFDPPLSATEITQERLRLEDCIRRVEAEAAKGILTQTLSGRAPTQILPAPPPREMETRTSRPPFEPPTRSAPPVAPPPTPFAERAASRTYPQPVAPEPPTARWDRPERSNTLTGDRLNPERNRLTAPTGGIAADRRNTGLGAASSAQAPTSPPTGFGAPQPGTGQAPPSSGFSPRPAPILAPSPFEPPTAALRQATETGDQLGAVVVETAEHTRNILLAGAEADAYSHREPGDDAMPTAITGTPPRDMGADAAFGGEQRSRKPMIIGITAGVVVLAIGAGALWSQKDNIAAFFGDQRVGAARNGAAGVPPKSTDRLASDDQSTGAKPDVKKVQAEPITVPSAAAPTPSPAPTTAATPVLPPVAPPQAAPAAGPATGQATASAPQQQPVPMVAQRVSMMEENPVAGSQPIFSSGKVVWQMVKESQSGKPPVNVLRARVEIPDRRITMTLSMQPNSDATFSASHLVEVRFSVPGDFDAKGIANVPGIIMKPNEQATGSPLVGASAKISQNFFWFALAAGDADRQRNLALLKDSGWMAIPVVYDTGKRGLITIEKAGAGDRALTDALAAWQ